MGKHIEGINFLLAYKDKSIYMRARNTNIISKEKYNSYFHMYRKIASAYFVVNLALNTEEKKPIKKIDKRISLLPLETFKLNIMEGLKSDNEDLYAKADMHLELLLKENTIDVKHKIYNIREEVYTIKGNEENKYIENELFEVQNIGNKYIIECKDVCIHSHRYADYVISTHRVVYL